MDNALVTSENVKSILRDGLAKSFKMNQESIGPPKFHFSGSIRQAMSLLDLLIGTIKKERHDTSWDGALVASENAEFVIRDELRKHFDLSLLDLRSFTLVCLVDRQRVHHQ